MRSLACNRGNHKACSIELCQCRCHYPGPAQGDEPHYFSKGSILKGRFIRRGVIK